MSTRIHTIAKELGISAKELLNFTLERLEQYDNIIIKSPTSAVMPIYADMIKADYIKYKECHQKEVNAQPKEAKTTMQMIKGLFSSLLPSKNHETTIVLVDKTGKRLAIDKYLSSVNITQAAFYIDTNCFCRFKKYEDTFNKIIESSKKLDQTYRPFYILKAVINELEYLKSKPKTKPIVESVMKFIDSISPYIRLKGKKEERFADNLILSEIMSNMTKKDIIIFTEDNALINDILNMNLNSTKSKYKIFIAKAI